jgi:hypothetical protein
MSLRAAARTLGGGALFALAVLAVQYSELLVSFPAAQDVRFEKKDNFRWDADISRLKPDLYYVSLGHYALPCQLLVNGQLLDSLYKKSLYRPDHARRSDIFLGGHLHVPETGRHRTLSLVCRQLHDGDPGRATMYNRAVVARDPWGMLIQGWRMFTGALLGPLMALFFLGTFLLQSFARSRDPEVGGMKAFVADLGANWHLLYFAASALAHSLVSADALYFFGSGPALPILYALSRNNLNLAVVVLGGRYSRPRPLLWALAAASMAASVWVGLSEEGLWRGLYDAQMYFYIGCTAVAAFDLHQARSRSRSTTLIRHLVTGWLLLQLLTLFYVVTGIRLTVFSVVPGLVTMATVVLSYMRYRETVRQQRLERATSRILAAVEGNGHPREVLSQLALAVHGETGFRRMSAYLDAFCLGMADEPGRELVRVAEAGYRGDTGPYGRIRFEEGRGPHMRAALERGHPALARGDRSEAWFTVVPVGHLACINLSDEAPAPEEEAWESLEAVERLLPALQVFGGALADVGAKRGKALDRLRAVHGDGRTEVQAGAVFADINDYSVLTERYGEPFSEFVASVYLPALVKAASPWAVPELLRGDEVYLVSLAELLPEGTAPREAALRTAQAVQAFARQEGAALSADHGFPALSLSVGANAGTVWLICDPITVRTSGRAINDAKRLQEAAPSGGTLAQADLVPAGELERWEAGPAAPILVKKNLILARELG